MSHLRGVNSHQTTETLRPSKGSNNPVQCHVVELVGESRLPLVLKRLVTVLEGEENLPPQEHHLQPPITKELPLILGVTNTTMMITPGVVPAVAVAEVVRSLTRIPIVVLQVAKHETKLGLTSRPSRIIST